MKYKFVKTAAEAERMCKILRSKPSIGFDVETTDLDPYHGELRLLQFSLDAETAFILDARDFGMRNAECGLNKNPALQPLRDLLGDADITKIGHNLKFDAKFVKHHLGVDLNGIFDTFLTSKIVGCGNPTLRHNLGAVAERFLGVEVDKTEQQSDWSSDHLTDRQLEYAARDVGVLHGIHEKIHNKLRAQGLLETAKIENDIVMAMAQLELNGFYLDAPLWRQQLRTVEGQAKRTANELQDMLSAGTRQMGLFGRLEIDLASAAQITQSLLGLGVPVPKTDKGNYTTQETNIEPLKYEFPVVDKLLDWRGLNKQLTSYGENILEFINPATGRIHADFAQLRAPSGRMGCGNPNLQNVPSSNEYRGCFTAPAGKKLIIADFSQIELRVMAEFSEDKAMIKAFASGKDYHTATAMEVFGITKPEDVTVEQRVFAKRVNFGIGYGIGAGKLSRMTGMPFEQTKVFLKKYFVALRGLDRWLKQQAYVAVKMGYVRTLSGRTVRFGSFDRRDAMVTSRIERQGKNIPIQGTAADIFKRALFLIHEDLKGTSGKLVNLVHDEFIIEVDESEADAIARRTEALMRQAGAEYIKLVEITVDAKVLDQWSK